MLSWSAQLGSARDLKEVDKTMYCGESGETAERERERQPAGQLWGGAGWPGGWGAVLAYGPVRQQSVSAGLQSPSTYSQESGPEISSQIILSPLRPG